MNILTATLASSAALSAVSKGTGGKGTRKGRVSRRGTYLQPPGHAPVPCLIGTKQALLVDMLARPGGATMEELREALSGGRKPWKDSTIRSGFSWDMKLKGYGVRSEFDVTGEERFHLLVPPGYTIPAHVTPEERAKLPSRPRGKPQKVRKSKK